MGNMGLSRTIEWPEALQCLFWPLVNGRPVRYRVLYGGRGGAKSWGIARALILLSTQKPLRILCARELQNSIRDSVHKVLADQIDKMGLSHLFVIEQARIFCPSTGSEFSFEGIRNNVTKIKSYEGVDICWVEEADKTSKNSWDVLIPTIRKEGSEIWVSFNPNLEEDDTYQRFIIHPPRNAIVQKISWRDNPWFPEVLKDEMLECRERSMDDYLHIWEGECRRSLEGAVYADELRNIAKNGQIMEVPHFPASPVNLYLDIGHSDYTSIIFEQYVGMQRRIIDFYQNRLKGVEHYVHVLRSRRGSSGELYEYGTMWLPHDAYAMRLGMRSPVATQFSEAGFNVRPAPKISRFDGIMQARAIFPTCWFDASRCEKELLHALRHYHYAENKDTQTLSVEPVHDWTSHAADAFRYMAVASQGTSERGRAARVRAAFGRGQLALPGPGDSLGWLG
jgi:phage terminase large subunit